MSIKEGGDPNAAGLAQKRWDKTKPKERSDHARKMNKARWGEDYVAKRPAAGRKNAAKRKTTSSLTSVRKDGKITA